MAKPKSSNPTSFVSLLTPDAHPALVRLAQNADHYIGASPEAKAELAERDRRRAEEDARERAGITLKGKRLDQARDTVSDVNLAAISVHQLAIEIQHGDVHQISALGTALENLAKVICRKGDVLDALLHNRARGSFGNFEDEFIALTEERAAELEREEPEAA